MDHRLSGSSVHGFLQARILSGLPCPPQEELPNPGTETASFRSPALAGREGQISYDITYMRNLKRNDTNGLFTKQK